jgi:hypothetical protein
MEVKGMKSTGRLPSMSILLLLTSLLGSLVIRPAFPPAAVAEGEHLAYFSGTLSPGETAPYTYQVFGGINKDINLEMQVAAVAGDGSIDLVVTDATGTTAYSGAILDGESLWASTTLTPGINTFALQNSSGESLDYDLWLYNVDAAPFGSAGTSRGEGTWQSHFNLSFPTSGLYQFDFGAASGRYQLLLGEEQIQKTVEGAGMVTYYVEAGVHSLRVVQDSAAPQTVWSLDISGPGPAADTLPYAKSGGDLGGSGNDFVEEWLPLKLDTPVHANFQLSLSGVPSDTFDVFVYAPDDSLLSSISDVYGGETLWWTTDLPAAVSRIQLVADPANTAPLAYDLSAHLKPTLSASPTTWSGSSQGLANNSVLRFDVASPGLFDFSFDADPGRFQFQVDGEPLILKTVETGGAARFFLPGGTHLLSVLQDPLLDTTDWSLALTATDLPFDSLPYVQAGGELGGVGNAFQEDWLPLFLEEGQQANFRLQLSGDLDDGVHAFLYHAGSPTPVYATPVVYGQESFWWTADLATGLNQIQLVANGSNAGPVAYELTVYTVPSLPYAWSGLAKGDGGWSSAQLDIPASDTYHIVLDTPTGFAQVLLDGTALSPRAGASIESSTTELYVPLSEGPHDFTVAQSPAYSTTAWSMTVTAAATTGIVAEFTGDLVPDEQVDPQIPIFDEDLPVNLWLSVPSVVGGGQLDLEITDGQGGPAFAGTALDGEALWATALLKPGQNTFTLHNTGSNTILYHVIVYEVDATPFQWEGTSRAAGTWDSHITLSFPDDALYTFDYEPVDGRYQFLVGEDYIQKTVEAMGTVSYFLPAGEHVLTIMPDRTADATWMLATSDPGAGADTLPYAKSGGDLGGSGNDFVEEWLPLKLDTPVHANFQLSLSGVPSDTFDVFVYAPDDSLLSSISDVYGGETLWWTTDLPAAVSRIQLVADPANTAPLAYDLSAHLKPTLSASPTTWSGSSQGLANNSVLRFDVASPGLFDFSFDADPGRFQFQVDGEPLILKTVETGGAARFFLPGGTHLLSVLQDPLLDTTDWSLALTATDLPFDSLPYVQAGGELGGVGNAFQEDWLPLFLEEGQQANFRLQLSGDLDDGVHAFLYQSGDPTPVYASPLVYGQESFWWTADLATGLNQIQLVANGSNAGPVAYELVVEPIPTVLYDQPYTWTGLSKSEGGHSEIELQMPVTATYQVVVDIPVGFANVIITGTAAAANHYPMQSHYEFYAPLGEGDHLFQVWQSTAHLTSTWAITATMWEAPPPQITSIDPTTVTNNISHELTILGTGFQPDAELQLGTFTLSPVSRQDSTELRSWVPAGLPTGVYSLTVTNPDGQSASLLDAVVVIRPVYRLHFPEIYKMAP